MPAGDPHRNEWSLQTKAQDTILVDGLGQPYGSTLGHGRIGHFEQHDDWVYMIGTAATAYPKTPLDRFDRLIHASNRMECDEGNRRVRVVGKRGEALITFVDPVTLQFQQDSQFDAGAVYWRNGKNFPLPDQWHMKATPRLEWRRVL